MLICKLLIFLLCLSIFCSYRVVGNHISWLIVLFNGPLSAFFFNSIFSIKLVVQSLPTPDICSSNPVIGNPVGSNRTLSTVPHQHCPFSNLLYFPNCILLTHSLSSTSFLFFMHFFFSTFFETLLLSDIIFFCLFFFPFQTFLYHLSFFLLSSLHFNINLLRSFLFLFFLFHSFFLFVSFFH